MWDSRSRQCALHPGVLFVRQNTALCLHSAAQRRLVPERDSSFIQPVAVRLTAFHWLRSVPQMESCNAQHIVRGLGRTNARSMSDRAASGPYRRRGWINAEIKGSTQHQTGLTLCLEHIARDGRYPTRLQNDTRREEVKDVQDNAGLRCGGRRGRQPPTSSAYANDLTDVVSKVW